jgi:predicted nucleic acid-binding protein
MVLVDTTVWSLALRRRAKDLRPQDRRFTQALYELVREGRVQLLGLARQEVLSGIREESQFRRILDDLRAFPDVALDIEDYEEAARLSNECRKAGIASSSVDMLMCAVALRHDWKIFSADRAFLHYRRVIPLKLFP